MFIRNKKFKQSFVAFFIVLGFFLLLTDSVSLAQTQTYEPLEPIPGTPESEQSTFVGYVQAIYRFAVWSVGIAALLMISIGGFMYFTAAGNNSRMETAKGIIADAIFGLVAVMVAWLVLNQINPDLVNINLDSISNLQTQ